MIPCFAVHTSKLFQSPTSVCQSKLSDKADFHSSKVRLRKSYATSLGFAFGYFLFNYKWLATSGYSSE